MRIILNEAKGSAMDFYLQRLQEALTAATRGMTVEDLTRHPEGKWNTLEVLEHLYLTYTGTAKGFERCLKAGKPIATLPTLKQRLATTLVVKLGHMPRGRKAPNNTRPQGVPAEKVMTDIWPWIVAMDDLIGRCEERYGRRTKLLDHPILGPLTGRQWRKFHWVHGRHHVKQILRLRQLQSG